MHKKHKKRLIRIILSSVMLVVIALIKIPSSFKMWLYFIPYFIIGYDVLSRAIKNIFKGRVFDENFLMSIATIGAIIIGEYPEAVFVMLFYQIGDMFESIAVGKSRKSISDLMDLNPDYTNVERNGKLHKVTPDKVKTGEITIIMPGEKIAIDGIVTDGHSSIDTSALTGEPIPKDVTTGDSVSSGCINISSMLKIKTTNDFGSSTASKILELVENSSFNKAKTESFITRFSRYYTPIVVICALLLALIPSIITGNISEWVGRALIFLVVSCPCALVISVPLSFFGGIGAASKQGILIKGSNYLEMLAKAGTIVFDKTGTLTKGSFHITNIHPNGISEKELLMLAAAAERYSNHPISVSIKNECTYDISDYSVTDYKEMGGFGINAKINGREIYVGNKKLMEGSGISVPDCTHTGTLVHISVNSEYLGHIEIDDCIKEDSTEAIRLLKKTGVKNVIMLTGDKKSVAEAISKKLCLDECYYELLPNEKVMHIEKIINDNQNNGTTVYAGDGINDAPVLARADVGIAMGGLGSDAAIEAADIVIMDDKPSKICTAIKISKKTKSIVMQNIIFALGVKFIVLVLGAVGYANMWLAVFADVGVSVIAIINATRTLKTKKLL